MSFYDTVCDDIWGVIMEYKAGMEIVDLQDHASFAYEKACGLQFLQEDIYSVC